MSDILEHHRMVQQGRALADKIDRRSREAIGLKGHAREQAWLADAAALLAERLDAMTAPLEAARFLPELEGERETFARAPQQAWVDALEKLWAGISYHLGRRAPLLEALFPHGKFAALRKPKPELVREYAAELEKRRHKGYVERLLGDPDAAFAKPLLDAIAERFAEWEAVLAAPALEGEPAETAREAVRLAARKLEPAMRQARHLFEAAGLTLPEPDPDSAGSAGELAEELDA